MTGKAFTSFVQYRRNLVGILVVEGLNKKIGKMGQDLKKLAPRVPGNNIVIKLDRASKKIILLALFSQMTLLLLFQLSPPLRQQKNLYGEEKLAR